jgi:plastocyanin
VADERLRKVLGLSRMTFHGVDHPIAITDMPLEAEPQTAAAHAIAVDNFSFAPARTSVAAGTAITWTNHDDVPHNIVSTDRTFKSSVLDTGDTFTHRFETAGAYKYFCSLHPRMTGEVVVG